MPSNLPGFDEATVNVRRWSGERERTDLLTTPDSMPPHVSVENQLPQDLYEAMGRFISGHPQWDQYRLVQVAIAGFLFQQGCEERVVAQHYLKRLFQHQTDPCRITIDRLAVIAAHALECCTTGSEPMRSRDGSSSAPAVGRS